VLLITKVGHVFHSQHPVNASIYHEMENLMTGKSSTDADNQAAIEAVKKEFNKPNLKFIEPKLTKHGDATKITGTFFGTFNPDDMS